MDKAGRSNAATAYWSREVSWAWRRMLLRAPASELIMQMRFSHPHVRNRLERLMGSNVTRLTDRDFMQRLAERIQEEHVAQMQKRIRAREEAEVEREKKLILEGKIPVEQVPRELAEHPVFKISRITSEAIESRRSKVQHPTMRLSYIPEGTLQALAKAMAPEEDEVDEEDREQAQAAPATPEESEELLESVQEEEEEEEAVAEVQEEVKEEAPPPKDEQEQLEESLKKDIEERVEKEGEKRALKGVLKTGYDRQEERADIKKKLEKKIEARLEAEDEKEEVKAEAEDVEGDDEVSIEPEPEPVLDDYDYHDDDDQADDYRGVGPADAGGEKRSAVHRHSQMQKEHRRKRLATKGGVPAYSEDGRPLSPDEVERERANLARTSVMTAARNEWQAEVELAEQMARERDKNYLLSEAELRRLRYEAPLIEELRKQETVADLYRLADEIVGGLWIKSKPGK